MNKTDVNRLIMVEEPNTICNLCDLYKLTFETPEKEKYTVYQNKECLIITKLRQKMVFEMNIPIGIIDEYTDALKDFILSSIRQTMV